MKLGVEVGLGPGHIALYGDLAMLPKGVQPAPIFGPCLVWPNGWLNQGATWWGGRPRPRRHCVRWGPSSPPQKGALQPALFGPCLLWPNEWIKMPLRAKVGLGEGHIVLDGGNSCPYKGHSP